jgi:malate synthase
MAKVVDKQNENDKNYTKMSDDYERSLAFNTACDLIFKGKEQPSGYTEPLLHYNRLKKKINQS